jgi:hypothetical protein
MIGCARTDLDRVQNAGAVIGRERAADAPLPELPPDCRRQSRSGVVDGDRLDVALLKTDAALARQNARTRDCAAWYDELRAGLIGGAE